MHIELYSLVGCNARFMMGSSDYIASWLHLFKCAASTEAQKTARSSYLKVDLGSTEYSICVLPKPKDMVL